MIDYSQLETWLLVGSQHLYGPETLAQVAQDAMAIVADLNQLRNELRWNELAFAR